VFFIQEYVNLGLQAMFGLEEIPL